MSDDTKGQASAIGWEKCERLLHNPDVQWFIAEAITKARTAKAAELQDPATDKDARDIAAHVREALEQAETFLTRQRDIYSRGLPKVPK